jgi:hypothetical protein
MRAAVSGYICMNYGGPSQDPLSKYSEENLRYVAVMARKYDPARVFHRKQIKGER